MNSLVVIHPYKVSGVWVFNDPRVGLVQEPLVSWADVILDRMVAGIPDAEFGVTISFPQRIRHRFYKNALQGGE